MKCPACQGPLRQKSAGPLTLDVCYGGCGGIWFDQTELNRVDARGAASLHTVWRDPNKPVVLTEPRLCPRCPDQVLDRKWFSDSRKVEIDQCPRCGGIWLDEGEFSRIYGEMDGARVTSPLWAVAMAEAAKAMGSQGRPAGPGPSPNA